MIAHYARALTLAARDGVDNPVIRDAAGRMVYQTELVGRQRTSLEIEHAHLDIAHVMAVARARETSKTFVMTPDPPPPLRSED